MGGGRGEGCLIGDEERAFDEGMGIGTVMRFMIDGCQYGFELVA